MVAQLPHDHPMIGKSLPITFYPKKSSIVLLLVVCSSFVALGIWVAPSEGWFAYLCAGFFALGIPIAIIQLLPSSSFLHVDEEGLAFANLFRVTHIPWEAVDQFFVMTAPMTVHKMVAMNFASSYDCGRSARRVVKAIANCEGALPDTYGQKADDLASFLNACLQLQQPARGKQRSADLIGN